MGSRPVTGARANLQRPITLFALSGLYPAVFHASHNWFAYTGEQLWMLLGGTVAAALLLGTAAWLAVSALLSLPPVRARLSGAHRDRAKRLLASLISLGGIAVLMHASLSPEGEGSFVLTARLGMILGAASLWCARVSLGPQIALLLMLSGFAAAEWGWSASQRPSHHAEGRSWYDANKSINDGIEFARKPNVYAIVLESYNSPAALEKIYGLDIGGFVSQLEERGFDVEQQFFSNYSNTILSISSMMAMEHHYGHVAAGMLDAFDARELIGGKHYNAVLDVVVRNGYETQYVLSTDYMFIRGDALDFAFPERTPLQVFKIYELEPLDRLLRRFGSTYDVGRRKRLRAASFSEVLEERLDVAAKSRVPYFSLIKPAWTRHSNRKRTWRDLEHWPGEYREGVDAANPKILRMIDGIVERDPTAIIVVIGDHGAWRWRWVWGGDQDLNQLILARGVTGETLALDLFGVFFGIRGAGEGECFDRLHSSVNLFRCIFAELAEDDAILTSFADSESLLNASRGRTYVGARDGRALRRWTLLKPSHPRP